MSNSLLSLPAVAGEDFRSLDLTPLLFHRQGRGRKAKRCLTAEVELAVLPVCTLPLIVRRKPRPLIYNAPDLIPKVDSLDARNRNGTFKVTTLIDGTEILLRRLYRLGSGSYLVVDKNGQTLPSSIQRTENGCFLCWDNCQKAVRIKCPPG